jgi:hypothetical protein
MRQIAYVWFAVMALFVCAGRTEADPIFVTSYLYVGAEGSVVPDGNQYSSEHFHFSGEYHDAEWTTVATSHTPNGTIAAFVTAVSTWKSSSRGQVSFSDTGFLWGVFQENGVADFRDTFWSYTFTSGSERTFSLKYQVGIGTSSTSDMGADGFTVTIDQDGDVLDSQYVELVSSGKMHFRLEPGGTYTVTITPAGAVDTGPDVGVSTMWGQFDWKIR